MSLRAINTPDPIYGANVYDIDELVAALQDAQRSIRNAGGDTGATRFKGRVVLHAGEQPNSFILTILKRN